jgi:periplasmic divalent cation tolerance protein
MSSRLLVLMTCGSEEEADTIAHTLVAELLAACVNILPPVTSVYRWEGEIQRDQEWLLIAKTRVEVLDELKRRVGTLHGYDLPEVITIPIVGGSERYLRWLDGEVHGGWHDID